LKLPLMASFIPGPTANHGLACKADVFQQEVSPGPSAIVSECRADFAVPQPSK
jgi:hypothetical protein